MRIGYFDCFSGASGDMILAACIAAGADLGRLRQALAGLGVEGFRLEAQAVRKQGFAATQVEVQVDPAVDKPHRHLKHILRILEAAKLPDRVREQATKIFTRLAEAEAAVHGTSIEKVHFHEVGAIDAIVDVVGACLALDQLEIEQVVASAIPTGNGTVQCEHGLMPVPAPATAALLKGVPLAACDEEGELTTPTGAAILTTLASGFGARPPMRIEQIGIGAGRREGRTRPNILRLFIGELVDRQDAGPTRNASPTLEAGSTLNAGPPLDAGSTLAATGDDTAETDQVVVLEAGIDDMTGQAISHLCERLFDAGALDAFTSPIYMKKGRPAVQITVLAPAALRQRIEETLFTQSTTFGLRWHLAHRSKLARHLETVTTEVGELRMKVGRRRGQIVRVSPEFEDCRAAAERTGRPLIEIMDLARKAWWEQMGDRNGGR